LDFSTVEADAALKTAIETSLKTTMSSLTGVPEANIGITLSAGSVKATFEITSTGSITSSAITSILTAKSTSGDLTQDILTGLNNVDIIVDAATGELSVSDISSPEITQPTSSPSIPHVSSSSGGASGEIDGALRCTSPQLVAPLLAALGVAVAVTSA
jgi:hypothetical protein